MATILPEPLDGDDVIAPSQAVPKVKKQKASNKKTMWFMVSLVIIAIICLMVAFFYDFAHNRAQDNTRKQDLSYIAGEINDYHNLNRFYPTLAQVNSTTFSAFNPSLNRSKFTTPDSTSVTLVAYPSDSNYAYQPMPLQCNNTTVACTSYKLIAVLNDGSQYTLSSSTKN